MADAKKARTTTLLVLIGVTKVFKALMFLFLATQLHRLLDPNVGNSLRDFCHHVRVDPDNRHVHALIEKLTGVSPATLRRLRLGSYLYAALFATEGLGLIFRRKWAEYMTVITTSLLLPVEAYEIFHGHHHVGKIVFLVINVAIVVYLIGRLPKKEA
ncbi:MAG TPA: DUF2127 domain-containing protein [Tepidisphaeraceae bacterium]|jgi:uncharacterized membrane protein (DUF2068 family)|nr:DUF2127 domain-containing protein [Tepidisphaeraceae bacterium]